MFYVLPRRDYMVLSMKHEQQVFYSNENYYRLFLVLHFIISSHSCSICYWSSVYYCTEGVKNHCTIFCGFGLFLLFLFIFSVVVPSFFFFVLLFHAALSMHHLNKRSSTFHGTLILHLFYISIRFVFSCSFVVILPQFGLSVCYFVCVTNYIWPYFV